ncbi:MAG: hypothetical protein KatS3mg115_1344 [Candidatus Poribacteria bacterium]|nr:MAG: hypothetical protein KatS3mg115_1344 [Candidatus Poribacteria bacterium]
MITGGARDPALAWRQVVEPCERRRIPWAAVFGNHDDEGSLSRQELMRVQRSMEWCLSEPGPPEVSGVGNYVLPLFSATEEDRPAALLYFLDSNSYAETTIGGYGWFRRDQIAWYVGESLRWQQQVCRRLPALAFFHIPLPEYNEVWDEHPCYGYKFEAICCPKINTGLFAAFHEMGDVIGTFVAHDHINDFCGELHGIWLCYGRASGIGTYGKEGFPRGARVIRLHEGERRFETWLRLDGGEKVAQQPLHEPAGRVLSETYP